MNSHYFALLTELGVVITKGDDHIVVKTFAFSNPVSDYLAIKSGAIPKSCSDIRSYIESLNTTISTGDESLINILKKATVDTNTLEGRQAEDVRAKKQQIMIAAGLASDSRDIIEKLREFATKLSSSKVTKISSSVDLHVIQAVNSLDEVDKVANALSSRIKEWYGLHFPELENIVDSIEGYARIVLSGRRNDLTVESFAEAGFPSEKSEMLLVAASKSRGGEISDKNLEMVQSIAEKMISCYNLRRDLEEVIEDDMNKTAPNLSAILGASLSARMLARVGSIKRMATLPASTIQILGAERALFRALKTGSEPPKHGLLFQHPMVHAAPRWQRGKIARAIASKAVIAVRVDVYNEGEGLNSTLLEKLNIRVGEINEKFQEPTETKNIADSRYNKDSKSESSRYQDTTRVAATRYRQQQRGGGGSRHKSNKRDDNGEKHPRPKWADRRVRSSKQHTQQRGYKKYTSKKDQYDHQNTHQGYKYRDDYNNDYDGGRSKSKSKKTNNRKENSRYTRNQQANSKNSTKNYTASKHSKKRKNRHK